MSNLLDKASIILTATAYNTSEVLCVKPSDGSGDFDFSRATEATRVNAQGLIENEANNLPRINYSGFSYDGSGNIVANSGCGAWLFEPQSTNLITYSEAFDNAYWTKSGASVTSGFTSPDGTANAFKLVEDTSTAVHRLAKTFTVSTATDYYSLSVRVKKGEIGALILGLRAISFANRAEATFDLTNGVISVPADDSFGNMTNASAKIDLIANGYYNISLSVQKNTDTALVAYIYLAENITDTIATAAYTGDGTSGVYIFGAQLEQLSYATSYIPTSGTTVTRNQDLCTNGGDASLINSTEGVLYVEMAALADDGTNKRLTINQNTTNRIGIEFNTSGQLRFTVRIGASFAVSAVFTTDITVNNKIAFKYKSGDCSFYLNGVNIGNATGAFAFAVGQLSKLDFSDGGNIEMFGKTKALAVWKEALTDAELTALTTI